MVAIDINHAALKYVAFVREEKISAPLVIGLFLERITANPAHLFLLHLLAKPIEC